MDKLTFERENRERIQAVETSYGPSGKPLYQPGLIKQGHRKIQPKAFFLFNDVLVYGSIILKGRWHKNQKILPLENITLKDREDSEALRNQWLIRTPPKSFYASAPSCEEKQAWMKHIEECRARLLQGRSHLHDSNFAVCMRCLIRFQIINHRYHCRKCGFVVCRSCSSHRKVIEHIHPTKLLRVCGICYKGKEEEEMARLTGDSSGMHASEDNDLASPCDEEDDSEFEINPGELPHLLASGPFTRRRSLTADRPSMSDDSSGCT